MQVPARALSRLPSRVSKLSRARLLSTTPRLLQSDPRLDSLQSSITALRSDLNAHMLETKAIRSLMEKLHEGQELIRKDLSAEIDDVDSSFSRLELRMDRILQGIEEEEALLKDEEGLGGSISPNCSMGVGVESHESGNCRGHGTGMGGCRHGENGERMGRGRGMGRGRM